MDRTIETYLSIAGWELIHRGFAPKEQALHWGLAEDMVIEQALLRAPGFGLVPDMDGGSLEIYSFEGATGRDYSGAAHPPNLGNLMYRVHVPDLDEYAGKLANNGAEILRPMSTVFVPPYGKTKALTVESPTGSWIEFFEQQ